MSLRRLVTVTADELIVRSGFGARTLPWSTVLAVNLDRGTVSVTTAAGQVPLRIPATRQHWFAADPRYYRKWAWLQQILVVPARPDGSLTDRATGG